MSTWPRRNFISPDPRSRLEISAPPFLRLLRLLAAFPVCTALLLSGCAKREPVVVSAARAGILHAGINGEPSELDPHVINAPPDFRVIHALFEGLLRSDPATGAPLPGVAESWSASADGLVYTFKLRAEARWSNGDPVTAADFLFSFRRALSPALGSQYTLLFNPVRGAAAFAAGKLDDFAQVGFAAPDPRTVVVTLAQPTPYFLALVAGNPVWFPVHPATVLKFGKPDQRGTGWTRAGRLVGNGPFVLPEWKPNERIVATKSPTYWNAASIRLNALNLYPIDSVDTEERAFRAGQLHVTTSVPVSRILGYVADKDGPLRIMPLLNSRFLNVNTTRPGLRDPRVRRALALVLDRATICRKVLTATEAPAYHVVPDGMPGYQPAVRLGENVALARDLLALAGFPEGRGFPKLTLRRVAGSGRELAEVLQETWRTQLGVEIALLESESRVHWSLMQQKDYDLAVGGWNADYPDASTYLDLFTTQSGWNFTGWSDAAYDMLVAQSSRELDPAARLHLLQQAEARLVEECPVIPLSFARNRFLLHPAVRDWPASIVDRTDYNTVYLLP